MVAARCHICISERYVLRSGLRNVPKAYAISVAFTMLGLYKSTPVNSIAYKSVQKNHYSFWYENVTVQKVWSICEIAKNTNTTSSVST